jgi:hypothetical protein
MRRKGKKVKEMKCLRGVCGLSRRVRGQECYNMGDM